jgi:hypothetical protein
VHVVAPIYTPTGRPAIDEFVRATAAGYQSPDLRSLNAINLATAHAVFGGASATT